MSLSGGGASKQPSFATRFAATFDFAAHRRLRPDVKEDFIHPSALGACVSLVGVLIAVIFVFCELVSFLSVRPSLGVALAPASQASKVSIVFNVTVEKVSCELLHLSLSDALGAASVATSSSSSVHFYAVSSGRVARRVKETDGALLPRDDGAPPPADASDGRALALDVPPALTVDSYEAFVKSTRLALVSFGAPWCPYSRALAPIITELGTVIGNRVPGVRVGTVDCTVPDAEPVCRGAHIAAFPTVHLYAGGIAHSHFVYNGERSVAALSAFLVRASQLGDTLMTAPDEAHAQLLGHHADDSHENEGHHAARARLLQLMSAPLDQPDDPADPGIALSLVEAIHRAGLTAPGDAARAARTPEEIAAAEEAQRALKATETSTLPPTGCNIAGEIAVPRVPGRLVFSVGGAGVTVDAARVNLTHYVHSFRVGAERLSPYQARRLGGTFAADAERLAGGVFTTSVPLESFTHYLSVVPHRFRFATGHAVDAFAYSAESGAFVAPQATDAVASDAGPAAPSLAFAYEITPLAVTVTELRPSYWRLLLSVAAILGGTVAAGSVLDSLLHAALRKNK